MSLTDHKMHFSIARDLYWLLDQYRGSNSNDELFGRYIGLLIDRHLATSSGVVRKKRLHSQFLTFYSKEFLNELHCDLDCKSNWLWRMLKNTDRTQHPIRHLLLMNFLDVKAEAFFSLPTIPQPFGAGPWPCLNPACQYYRSLVITECKLKSTESVLYGLFQCECGFRYYRRNPSLKENEERTNRIDSLGPVWEAKLCELYQSGNYTVTDIAKQLRVGFAKIWLEVRKLSLIESPLNREGHSSDKRVQYGGRNKKIPSEELISRAELYKQQ